VGSPDPDAASDAEHIRASWDDPRHFTALFERHAVPVHRFLARRAEPASVDDLLSETFVAAFRTRRNYDLTYEDARPWLFGIAVNVVRHHHRSEARRTAMVGRVVQRATREQTVPDTADDALGRVEFEDRVEGMAPALRAVDPKYLDVLLLLTGPQLTYAQIARALGIPVGTVRSRLSRGRAQLRELLDESGQYLGDEVAHPSLENRND
jgi:RNA polymerase sigma factor (sigma-70 family)